MLIIQTQRQTDRQIGGWRGYERERERERERETCDSVISKEGLGVEGQDGPFRI